MNFFITNLLGPMEPVSLRDSSVIRSPFAGQKIQAWGAFSLIVKVH